MAALTEKFPAVGFIAKADSQAACEVAMLFIKNGISFECEVIGSWYEFRYDNSTGIQRRL